MAWAIDCWPYVNGKALMSGLRLRKMESAEMIDVLHFLFEEDFHFVSEESAKSRSGVRVALYREMYGKPYKYEYKESKKGGQNSNGYASANDLEYMTDAESAAPFGPAGFEEPMKPPAQAPTEFDPYAENPFKGILDAPMN